MSTKKHQDKREGEPNYLVDKLKKQSSRRDSTKDTTKDRNKDRDSTKDTKKDRDSTKDTKKDRDTTKDSTKDTNRDRKSNRDTNRDRDRKRDSRKEDTRKETATKHRRSRSEPKLVTNNNINTHNNTHNDITNDNTNNINDDTIHDNSEGFFFIYEANGTFYNQLETISKTDGRMIIIHPVYYAGYTNNMNSEEVVYDEKTDKYISSSDEGSWLDLIYNYPDLVHNMNSPEAVIYDDKFFHCDGDLLEYLIGSDLSTVPLL